MVVTVEECRMNTGSIYKGRLTTYVASVRGPYPDVFGRNHDVMPMA